jgi:hypothetical protein
VVSAAYVERFQMLPSLARFDARFGKVLFSMRDAELSVWQEKSSGDVAGAITLRKGRWPGIEFHDLWPNWESYSELGIEIENPGPDVLSINIRVDDQEHRRSLRFDDRFNKMVELPPGRQSIHIKLTDIRDAPVARQMNLRKIDGVWIFASNEEAGKQFILHEIRLE